MKRCPSSVIDLCRWFPHAVRRLLPGALLLFAAGAGAEVGASVRDLIESQRRILILREAANRGEQAEARRAGQYLFFRNHELGRKLVDEVTRSASAMPGKYRELVGVLDESMYLDEDRLILRNVLDALARKLPPAERLDAVRRLERLGTLRKTLGEHFDEAFRRVPLKQNGAHASRWADYLARITEGTTARQILDELDQELMAVHDPAVELKEAAARARVLEWNGEELPERTVLLTFDDGPHPIHTPLILDILKEHGVRAVFFAVGRNLGEVRHGLAQPGHNQPLVSRLLAEGHAVGNHSFSHPVLTSLDLKQLVQEIESTQVLINAMVPAGNGRTEGFRPPYGARDDKVLSQIDQHRLRSVVWNIDSEDWADPLPESIAHRILREAEKAGRGIVLMHDIHARTVEALPIAIRELKRRGFRFARWDGHRMAVEPAPEN